MKALVTGGGGYIGRHVVKRLLDRGDEVTVLGRRSYPEVEAWGAKGVQADLSSDVDLAPHVEGMDVVFHVAALPPYHAPREVFWRTNVEGTRRVIDACQRAGVPRLVYTSSPSAVHAGDAEGLSEADCPYPDHWETPYAETKAVGEQEVLAANSDTLATTSLRPHLVYGPEEPHMLPRVLDRHRSGRLRRIGDGTNRMGLTYIDNAAIAHLQAADALAPGSANAGKAYFVTDRDPVVFWTWLDTFLTGVGEKPLTKTISHAGAHRVGAVMETLWKWLPIPGEPPMTRFVASQLATSHWYDLSAGRDDFGLAPIVDGEEGLARTIAWFAEHGQA